MRYPSFLTENGKIGFLAPSFGCATEPYKSAFDNALRKFKERKHDILLGPNVYEGSGVGISSSPRSCGEEVNQMFSSDADVLISCGGGELMCEILPYIDFDRLKAEEPKLFMGYSDNTNLTFLLNTICDTAAIYGPCASTFGQNEWHSSIEDAYKLLRGTKKEFVGYDKWEMESLKSAENPFATYNVTENRILRGYIGKEKTDSIQLEGRLLGGCLDSLAVLSGTKFDHVKEFNVKYAADGVVWFLESCELKPFDIRRAMWKLRECGWFENANGFIIGRSMLYGMESMGLDMYEAYLGAIGDMGLPIVMDIDIGHLAPQIPILSGAYAKICMEKQEFDIEFTLK